MGRNFNQFTHCGLPPFKGVFKVAELTIQCNVEDKREKGKGFNKSEILG